MKNAINRERGFTLVEMMVALTIGAIIVAPLYIVTRSMSQGTDMQRMNTEATQRARIGLDILVRDFRRAGLFASPSTEADEFCKNPDGSSAQYRNAVVHLNRGKTGNDAVLLTGNFLGGRAYLAYATGSDELTVQKIIDDAADAFPMTQDECLTQFNSGYSFANITGPTEKTLDARVESVGIPNNRCIIGLRSEDLNKEVFGEGNTTVYVSANQTALYFVETVTDIEAGKTRGDLVRYFVDYVSDSSPGSSGCDPADTSNYSAIESEIPGTVIDSTRKVIAEYVEDFQVWFRPVTVAGNPQLTEPHHPSVVGIRGQKDGNFPEGFLPADEMYVMPLTATDDTSVLDDNDNISCAADSVSNIGPQHVRSAVIRLTVRTEKTDPSIDFEAFDLNDPDGPVVRHNLAGSTDGGVVGAYKLKTFVTEVPLANIAARTKILIPKGKRRL
ncbi:MAG: prepilin-type N-terminal cleavage/methylation domain-containing protein [Proteobacteria bacterium]|nr:prepilin-type N-terminal cleavage/methylation domain-containing protein [Pseudomonadota bacterium]